MQRADPLAFRQAASRFATGVAVLTALDSRGEVCGMTAAAPAFFSRRATTGSSLV